MVGATLGLYCLCRLALPQDLEPRSHQKQGPPGGSCLREEGQVRPHVSASARGGSGSKSCGGGQVRK